jgi:hypothetical protein
MQAARRLPGVPAEALAEFPPAWGERGGLFGWHSSPFIAPAIAATEQLPDTERHRQLARTAAERAVSLRRNAVRKQPAASRASRTKASRNLRALYAAAGLAAVALVANCSRGGPARHSTAHLD